MKHLSIFLTIILLLFSCKSQAPEQIEKSAENKQLPKYFYKHLSGQYMSMPAKMNITVIDTAAYITLIYGQRYGAVSAVVQNFKQNKFHYNLLSNLRTRDTVEIWHGEFTSDSALDLRVIIPIRDTVYKFVEDYEQSVKIRVINFDTTIFYKDTDQELFIFQANSIQPEGLDLDFPIFSDSAQLQQDFEQAYKMVLDYITEYNPESPDYFYPFYYNCITAVEYNDNNLLVVSKNCYEYLGGAHGMNTLNYYNIDLKQKRLLQIDDILEKPQDILPEIYQKVHELTDNLFVSAETIPLPKNFYILGSKLIFVYNVYEIAPYSEGTLSAEFSFKELGSQLRPEFIKKFFPEYWEIYQRNLQKRSD